MELLPLSCQLRREYHVFTIAKTAGQEEALPVTAVDATIIPQGGRHCGHRINFPQKDWAALPATERIFRRKIGLHQDLPAHPGAFPRGEGGSRRLTDGCHREKSSARFSFVTVLCDESANKKQRISYIASQNSVHCFHESLPHEGKVPSLRGG